MKTLTPVRIKSSKSSVNLVFFTDVHLSAVPPGKRRDNYREAILNKLRFTANVCQENDAYGVCGGDFFHVKSPQSKANPHSLVQDAIEVLQQFPDGKVFGDVGNHDISNDRMDSLDSQPLGVLIKAGVYHNIEETPVLLHNYMDDVSVEIRSVCFASSHEMLEGLKSISESPRVYKAGSPDEPAYRVVVMHTLGCPGKTRDLFGELQIGYDDLADLDIDVILWGHDHSRYEAVTVGNVRHIHYGSLSRASLASDEVERPVSLALLSFKQNGFSTKEIKVPVSPLEVAFTTADRGVAKVSTSDEMKAYFSDLEASVDGVESDDPIEILNSICPEKDIRELVIQECNL